MEVVVCQVREIRAIRRSSFATSGASGKAQVRRMRDAKRALMTRTRALQAARLLRQYRLRVGHVGERPDAVCEDRDRPIGLGHGLHVDAGESRALSRLQLYRRPCGVRAGQRLDVVVEDVVELLRDGPGVRRPYIGR